MCVAPPRRLPSHSLINANRVEVSNNNAATTATTSNRRRQHRRSIQFAKQDEIYEIPHIDDMSDEEIDDVWLSNREMKKVRQEARSIVSLIDSDDFMLDDYNDGLCVRGLDQHTKTYMNRRQAENDLMFEAVFRLQPFKQRTNIDVNVDGLIADLCAKYSVAAVVAAANRAKFDEQEAMAVHYNDGKKKATVRRRRTL